MTPEAMADLVGEIEQEMPFHRPPTSRELREAIGRWAAKWFETVEASSYFDVDLAALYHDAAAARYREDQCLIQAMANKIATEGRERGLVRLVDCGQQLVPKGAGYAQHGWPAYLSLMRITMLRTEPKADG